MVCIREYRIVRKKECSCVCSEEMPCCPDCGKKLHVHGTCRRKVIMPQGERTFILRVLACADCERTHRELPDFIIGYKRYSCDSICEIVENKDTYPCESSTRERMVNWLKSLLHDTLFVVGNTSGPGGTGTPDLHSGGQLNGIVSDLFFRAVNGEKQTQHRIAVT